MFVRPQEDYLLDRRPGVSTVMCEPRRTNGREASLISWCGELEACFGAVHSQLYSVIIIAEMSLGDWSSGGTPGPIPNPEVKPASADGTWLETARESRSLPRGILSSFAGIRITSI